MARTITSRRADTGLPDVANDFAFDDNTYFDDGTVFEDNAGSVLAGHHDTIRMRPRLRGRLLQRIFGE